MSIVLTYWQDAKNAEKINNENFDSISEVRLKSVKQIPELIAARPQKTTMISTKRTGPKKYFKQVYRYGQTTLPRPKQCPVCFHQLEN